MYRESIMHKHFFCLVIATVFFNSLPSLADADLDNYAYESEQFYPDKREKAALNSLRDGIERSVAGISSKPGEIVFNFGQGHHSVVCAVLELCDVAMEEGEHILGVQIGDSSRWSVDTAISGSGESETEHLIIKPYESNLKTSLMISTDRRAYHLALRSSINEYMPIVRFIYPDQRFGAFNSSRVPLKTSRSYSTPIQHQSYSTYSNKIEERPYNSTASSYSEDFEVTGDEEICPTKIFYDGRRTVISMRDDLPFMPVLHVNTGDSSDKSVSANYRLHGSDYIVDGLMRSATLKTTPADGNLEVVITYMG